MRKQRVAVLALVAFAALLQVSRIAVTAQGRDNGEAAFKAAMDKEVVQGDLKGAIEQYKKIAESKDHAIAVRALIRMAECYQKLGDAESRRVYEQILRNYTDQKEAVTLARSRLAGNAASVAMNSKLIWSGTEVDDEGTISPDGRYVSFPEWKTGALAIREFATGSNRHIVDGKQPQQEAGDSAISRDGKLIAYGWHDDTRDHHDELRLANLAGNANSRHLYDNPDIDWLVPLDWAPDGKSIVIRVARKDGTNQLALVSVPDGSFRVLKSLRWRAAGEAYFSPDGRWLGFDIPESDSQKHAVFVLSTDGSREVPVNHSGNDRMAGWSPDGKWLLFTSDRTGSTDLWAVQFGDGVSLGSPQLLKAGLAPSRSLGVSSSGTLYYGQVKGGSPSRIQIGTVDAATGKLTSSTLPKAESYLDSDKSPQWAPDGKRLAYVSERGPVTARNDVVVIRSIETGEVREFRDLQGKLSSANLDSWTPDGRLLLVNGQDLQGRWVSYLMDTETGVLKALGSFDSKYYNVVWSPDGRSFLIETEGSNPGLYRVDAGTGSVSQIMPIPPGQGFWGLYPAWSQDGKSVYYRRVFKREGFTCDCAIIERNIASGAERQLARRPSFLGPVRLMPDGQHILADTTDVATNSRVVLLVPTAGGESREVLRVPSGLKPDDLNNPNLGQWPFPTPLADGQSLLVVKRLGDTDSTGGLASGKDPSELWFVPLNGGEPKKIGNTPPAFNSAIFGPDRRHFAYVVTDPGSRPTMELWALENFLPKPVPAH
jgi:Tol biopolymer transport system component